MEMIGVMTTSNCISGHGRGVAYAWTTIANTDDVTGDAVETHVVTRFEFNESGKVDEIGNLREGRFI